MTLYYAGQRLTASDLNPIMAKYKNAAAQTGIANATNTRLTVPTQVYNRGGGIITIASNVITLGKTGTWEFSANVEFQGGINSLWGWVGHPSSATAADRYALFTRGNRGNGIDAIFCSGERDFTAGDQLCVWMWHDHGSNRQTIVTEIENWFSVRYIHGT